MFNDIYRDKVVLVTGHTGFKGSWLTAWLCALGAKVVGVSIDIPTRPSHFEALHLKNKIIDLRGDIRDREVVREIIDKRRPEFVFHLAAQSLVRRSYSDPIYTYQTNILGTLNVLDVLREIGSPCRVVIVTSDKSYQNREWVWGYRETDLLGGNDPYSGSKGAAELVIRSYINSFFSHETSDVRVGIGRAGNVIGGGDWAPDRIVPDCVRSWADRNIAVIRNPASTRPWQHVLEPLSGYMTLGEKLVNKELHGEAFNFGPNTHHMLSVLELVTEMSRHWDLARWTEQPKTEEEIVEAGLLKLNCDKALHQLGWSAQLDFQQTVKMTAEWYREYYAGNQEPRQYTESQIAAYSDQSG
jgi:CDP-glucose 4,6-dehydratase